MRTGRRWSTNWRLRPRSVANTFSCALSPSTPPHQTLPLNALYRINSSIHPLLWPLFYSLIRWNSIIVDQLPSPISNELSLDSFRKFPLPKCGSILNQCFENAVIDLTKILIPGIRNFQSIIARWFSQVSSAKMWIHVKSILWNSHWFD